MARPSREITARIGMPAAEEISAAGHVAGLLWITGGVAILAGLLVPGADVSHPSAVIVLAAAAVAWGLACMWIPFERLGPAAFLVPAAISLVVIALTVAFTGGARSPQYLLLFFVMAYVAYFFPRQIAAAYLIGCALVQALPLIYDGNAVADGVLGQIRGRRARLRRLRRVHRGLQVAAEPPS